MNKPELTEKTFLVDQTDSESTEPLLSAMWDQLVTPLIAEYVSAKERIASLRPPTLEEIEDLIEESDDPSIVAMRVDKEEAERLVEQLTEQLESWAKETLSVSYTPDERVTATQTFNRTKSQLISNLQAMLLQAEKKGLTEAILFIKGMMEFIAPKTTSKASRSDTTEERAWLKENHPEMKISDRGRIPEAAHNLWLEHNGS